MEKEHGDRKQLMHSEIHFRGYWVQLQSRIRKNDDADDYLEGYLVNPLAELRKAWNAHDANPRPAGDVINQLYNTGESVSSIYNFATCIKTLYNDTLYGNPPGNFPPTLQQLEDDPMKHFKDFIQATENGTKGGKNSQGRSDVAAKAWVKTACDDVKRCRKACKHIWDIALATFTSAKATTIIAGLPYGAGPALLKQIENQQERQTTMALFTLFDQLITLKLGAKENLASLFARAIGIRARLKNWNPPIDLPDQLIIVCLMRQLPRQFHGTRTIIMTTPSISLPSCRDMLLDVENRDAERVKQELGTASGTGDRTPSEGTGLLGDGGNRKPKKKKKKKRKPAEKSEKYRTEGPCSVHGSRCSHASSECYTLHPELKPKKKAEAVVAEAEVAEGEDSSQPYGFMNEEMGYCLMFFTEENDEKFDEGDNAAPASLLEPSSVDASPEAQIELSPDRREYEDLSKFAKSKGIEVPPYVARYDRDIDRVGCGICHDWMVEQRKLKDKEDAEHAKSTMEKGGDTDGAENSSTVSTIETTRSANKSKKVYAVAIGHQTGIFFDYGTAIAACKGYPGYRIQGFYNMKRAKQFIKDNQLTDTHVKKKITRKKPKSWGWSPKGTKATRRAAKAFPSSKNTIKGEVMQFKRSKSTHSHDNSRPEVKRLARTGGVKELSEPEVIDLSCDSKAEGDIQSEEENDADTNSLRNLRDQAIKSLAKVIEVHAGDNIGVRSKRSFAPGLTTTMVYPNRVPRTTVTDEGNVGNAGGTRENSGAEKDVTFEMNVSMATLRRLVPGAKVQLKISRIESRSGEALVGHSNVKCKSKRKQGLYAFMNDYDADSEEESDDEATELLEEVEQRAEVEDNLSDDDEESSEGPPGLVDVPPGFESSDTPSSASDTSDDESSEGPPGLIRPCDLPPGYVSESSETPSSASDTSDDEEKEELVNESDADGELSEEPPPLISGCDDDGPGLVDDLSDDDAESDTEDDVPEIEARSEGLVNSVRNDSNNTALDSGATEHCAKHVKGKLDTASVASMAGLNGERTLVKGMGRVQHVNNVMCMPGISRNLLSVGRLLDEHGGQVSFTKDKAHLVTAKQHILVARRSRSGLYIVCNKNYELGSHSGEALAGTSVSLEVAKRRVIALHKAFGHASVGTLKTIIENHKFNGVTAEHLKLLPPCEACLLGKAHKAPKGRKASEKATRFAERLCADCSGPFRTRSVGGSSYLLVVICEFSSWTWVFPVSSLQQVVGHLTTILEVDLHQRDDHSVKYFRSDGGTEFNNKKVDELLAKHGIVRETTCANTSYQNGKAERRIRTLFDRVRTTLSDATLYVSRGFWADASVYAAYTLNRTPTEDGKSPFELRYGRKPKVSHLRPFGNPCVVYRKRTVAGKIQDAGVKGTFLGYGYVSGKKGYRVRIDGTNTVTTSRDVSFCAFESNAQVVQLLPEDATRAPDAVITEPANASEIDARLNLPVRSDSTNEEAGDTEARVSATITEPANASEVQKAAINKFTYTAGAKVEANWRGHGSYYPATVTEVHSAGANGSRSTYDLVYECDGEVECNVSGTDLRPRSGKANVSVQEPCGHALVTDCNPAYLADVPDLARAHVTPKHYGEASKGADRSKWTESMKDELESLKKQGVYAFVNELPTGEIALRCLWVYKVKCGADGEVTRYKSRLTVNGKSQRYGIDYKKTFSPVAFATSIRLLFALGIASKFKFRQYDIKCAFLYADLPKEQQVYMHAPPGSGRKGYWLLKKSLYGLKQAPMLFNGHLDNTLRSMGFTSCTFDPCLYIHRESGAYLVVVVDDMVLASPSLDFSTKFYKDLSKKYDVKDMGEPTYVIGVRVDITPHSVKFTQDRYISDLFALHKPGDRPTNTPATPNEVLCASGIYKQDESPLLSDPSVYRSLVGGLMYTLITRPDVAAAVSKCARYVQTPREAHLNAAKRILRFLHHTRDTPLVYRIGDNVVIKAFVDSSWANDVDTRRSRFGYAIFVGGCLVAWCSKLHPSLAMSSAEAEYTAATEATKAIKWIVSLMSFLGIKANTPIPVYEDNDACRIMSTSAQVSGRNKHFELRQHFVRNQVAAKLIKLVAIRTNDQIADIFTKPTVRPVFEKHATALLGGLPQQFPAPTVEGGC